MYCVICLTARCIFAGMEDGLLRTFHAGLADVALARRRQAGGGPRLQALFPGFTGVEGREERELAGTRERRTYET